MSSPTEPFVLSVNRGKELHLGGGLNSPSASSLSLSSFSPTQTHFKLLQNAFNSQLIVSLCSDLEFTEIITEGFVF